METIDFKEAIKQNIGVVEELLNYIPFILKAPLDADQMTENGVYWVNIYEHEGQYKNYGAMSMGFIFHMKNERHSVQLLYTTSTNTMQMRSFHPHTGWTEWKTIQSK